MVGSFKLLGVMNQGVGFGRWINNHQFTHFLSCNQNFYTLYKNFLKLFTVIERDARVSPVVQGNQDFGLTGNSLENP